MPFSPVPDESKTSINRAGQILAEGVYSQEEFDWAWDLVGRWRACHAYPINTFQSTLRTRLRDYSGSPIAAQRLKRMPTIIDKLRRYPNMKLTTMQDIGGLRAILRYLSHVRRLESHYRERSRFAHELIRVYDYIDQPRSEDGYRSLHLIYKYANPRNPHYDGLRIELQIRTWLQHIWATAVETMGTFLGQALKSRQGDKEWIDFFALASSAFAYQEKSSRVPRFTHMSFEETSAAVSQAEANLGALDLMRGLSISVDQIVVGRWAYHLIVLDSLNRRVELTGYDRDSFEEALSDYLHAEREAASGKPIEPVLVSAGPIRTLRRAYPNFFLDIGAFVSQIEKLVAPIRE
jgi:putative GTP pyrophosphokinase